MYIDEEKRKSFNEQNNSQSNISELKKKRKCKSFFKHSTRAACCCFYCRWCFKHFLCTFHFHFCVYKHQCSHPNSQHEFIHTQGAYWKSNIIIICRSLLWMFVYQEREREIKVAIDTGVSWSTYLNCIWNGDGFSKDFFFLFKKMEILFILVGWIEDWKS